MNKRQQKKRAKRVEQHEDAPTRLAHQLQRLLDVVEGSHRQGLVGHILYGSEPSAPVYYILDGHTPVPCPDLVQWEAWMSTTNRQVAETTLPSGTRIATLFRPIPYGLALGTSLLFFETQVFGGPFDEHLMRYAAWDEATAGHQALVAHVMMAEDNAVRCVDCGATDLEVYYTGQTWGETVCAACYDIRVGKGTARGRAENASYGT